MLTEVNGPRRVSRSELLNAFFCWAANHAVCPKACHRTVVTFADLGFELKSLNDIFQLDPNVKGELQNWAIRVEQKFVADTAIVQLPATQRILLEASTGKKFRAKGAIIMILRKRN